jgi:hypothetical protein
METKPTEPEKKPYILTQEEVDTVVADTKKAFIEEMKQEKPKDSTQLEHFKTSTEGNPPW